MIKTGATSLVLPLLVARAAQQVPSPPSPPSSPGPAASSPAGPPGVASEECCIARSRLRPADAAAPTDRKERLLLDHALRLVASEAVFYGEAPRARLAAALAALPPDAPPADRFNVLYPLADTLAAMGELDAARARFSECLALARAVGDAQAAATVTRQLAMTWLRTAERENCIAGHHGESCILPFSDRAQHRVRRGSEQAIAILSDHLDREPHDLAAIWLFNIAHMTLGSWPDGIAKHLLLPPQRFASEADFPRFRDVANERGLATVALAGGAVMDDLTGDGRLDVVVTSSGPFEPIALFEQQPDGTFRDVAAERGLAGQLGGFQCFARDWNGDRRLDLLVQRGAWLHEHGAIPNSLLLQQADGTFVDFTLEAGIEVAQPSLVAASADIDLDGDLDLFLGGESRGRGSATDFPCRLFRNRGDATFEEITSAAGVSNDRMCKGANFGDFDGDRDPDLYVSNLGQPNRLYRNEGDCRFTDVAAELGVDEPITSFGCAFFDADNDGALDLWVANYATPSARPLEMAAWYRDRTPGLDTMRLYRNDGRGRFRDATAASGLARVVFPMGCNVGDLDGDGFADLYLATGDPEFASLWPNILLKNERGQRFLDVTSASGTGHLQKGHGVAIGDIDSDGDQDLFVEIGGVLKDDAFASALFLNPGSGRRWLTVELDGRESDRFGVGARVRCTIVEGSAAGSAAGGAGGGAEGAVGDDGDDGDDGDSVAPAPTTRDVIEFVGTNASFGGNSLQCELGLGAATRIVALEVFWPTSGLTQRFTDVALDQHVLVVEGSARLETPRRETRR
jgi:hypothetical protein